MRQSPCPWHISLRKSVERSAFVYLIKQGIDAVAATSFCLDQGVDVVAVEALPAGMLERLDAVDIAVNALISPDSLRRQFLGHERLVSTLYGAIKPDPVAFEFLMRVSTLAALAAAIRAKVNPNPVDISEVLGGIAAILDASVSGVEIPTTPGTTLDLSKIDFEALSARVKKSESRKTDMEVLKAAIRAQLEKMIEFNPTRMDFWEKFEAMIESYNNGSRKIEDLFNELVKLTHSLSDDGLEGAYTSLTLGEVAIRHFSTAGIEEVMFDVIGRMVRERAPMTIVFSGPGRHVAAIAGLITKEHLADSMSESIAPYASGEASGL